MVTKPKLNGGLGVINLRLQNEVLLMKNYYRNGHVPGQVKKGSF
jgi:hypothetical protein